MVMITEPLTFFFSRVAIRNRPRNARTTGAIATQASKTLFPATAPWKSKN